MSCRPAYFDAIRQKAAQDWDILDQRPDLAGPWHQLFKQVQSPRHVLSELLQNADDAGATQASVQVQDRRFVFEHNGEDFTEDNFASLCRFGYTVFNVEQIEGLPAHYTASAVPRLNPEQRIERAETFFAATHADIRHGGNSAHYVPSLDYIQMPTFESFRDAGAYYATLAHESTHWTRHEKRLDRDFGRKRFGDQGYAMEELVAELGAAFLCADLDLVPQIRDDHAPYIAGWLRVLKDDKRAIFTAASHAQRAADFLTGLQPNAEPVRAQEAA